METKRNKADNEGPLSAEPAKVPGGLLEAANPERLLIFSDGLFAIIMTVLVLELRPPDAPTLAALAHLWPTALSYAVSYFFIAIVWINHHHLMRYAVKATPRLIWTNFAHIFSVTLIPFTTAWLGESRLSGLAVATYAAVFVVVNLTYVALCWEVVDRPAGVSVSTRRRALWRMRSVITLIIFGIAAVIGLHHAVAGMTLIALCLLFYTRPEAPGMGA
ncbi:TMEM175 family protein [Sphingopyxis panaciterrae]